MNDPHVELLHYEVGSGEGISYQDPEPLSFTNPLGKFEARDGSLVVEPSDHFVDEAAARAVVDPFLKAWEIESDLQEIQPLRRMGGHGLIDCHTSPSR